MAKTANSSTIASETAKSFSTAFEAAKNIEIPAAARDFVKRTATSAQERVESVHATAADATTRIEKLTNSFVGGYANIARGVLDSSLASAQHAFSTVEKLAAAKSLNEAVQIQSDYVRESAKSNFERAKTVAQSARVAITDGAKQVQAEFSALYPKKAA